MLIGSNIGPTVFCRGEAHRYTVQLHQSPCKDTKQKANTKQKQCSTTSNMVVIMYCFIGCKDIIAWGCFRKFSTELFDRPNAPLRLKARLLKAEAMEALLYGCMTWAPRNAHYRQLRTTHHKLLLRVIGYHRVHGTYRKMSYAKALKKTGSQSVEATIRQRRLLFAGALARQDDKRLPKRLLFAERLEGGQDPGPGQPAQHWQKSLRDDFKAFGALHGSTPSDRRTFGVDRLVWTEAARKGEGAPWYTGVLLGAERFMASWHKSEEEASKLREVNRAA